jgi:hypothetical protein
MFRCYAVLQGRAVKLITDSWTIAVVRARPFWCCCRNTSPTASQATSDQTNSPQGNAANGTRCIADGCA